jgi:hypothetical protein
MPRGISCECQISENSGMQPNRCCPFTYEQAAYFGLFLRAQRIVLGDASGDNRPATLFTKCFPRSGLRVISHVEFISASLIMLIIMTFYGGAWPIHAGHFPRAEAAG